MSIGTNSSIVLHLDSQFASSQLSSDHTTNFIYNLKESVEVPEHELCEVSLYSATIPYSFYNINDTNNEFSVAVKLTTEASERIHTLQLSNGNYTANSLGTAFVTLIQALADVVVKTLVFTVTYNRVTLKYDIKQTHTVSNEQYVHVNFTKSGGLFGFENNTNIDFTTNVTVSGTKAADLNDSIRGLYVRQNLTSKSTLDNETGTFSNILARVPITTNPGGVIFFNPTSHVHRANTWLHSISSVGIKLTNDKNQLINLNGLHFSLSILVKFVKFRNPIERRPLNIERKKVKDTKKRKDKKKR
jgi:hypothetical protein